MAHNHTVLDVLLREIALMVEDGEFERADNHFPDAEAHALRRMDLEEQVTYPQFERLTGIDADGPTAILRWEHREMREALAAMRVALAEGNVGDFHRAYEAFTRLESQHRVSEDRLLFPLIDQLLEGNALGELIARLDNRSTRERRKSRSVMIPTSASLSTTGSAP
jgi:iron-sulfur cluster repair protein YtfE (RIC family)